MASAETANLITRPGFLGGSDFSDPEYVRLLLRPASIKEDVKLMEQRRRVSLILKSVKFRKDLEKIIASQMRSGELSPSVMALKQLVDILTPQMKLGSSAFNKTVTMPVIPINDLSSQGCPYSKAEKLMRCKLAATYRLMHLFDWSNGTTSHISARVFKDRDEYLFNPRGLLFNEITASTLVKVNLKGFIIDHGATSFDIDRQSWMLHAAVHETLPTVRCVVQLSTPATMAVSSMKSGLLPISQEAMMLGEVIFYDPADVHGVNGFDPAEDADEAVGDTMSIESELERRRNRITEEYAAICSRLSEAPPDARLFIIKNYAILCLGRSIEEAWMLSCLTNSACESQLRLACIGLEELVMPTNERKSHNFELARVQADAQVGISGGSWRPGELEFEAMMRRLDHMGYKTGYIFRLSQVRQTRRHRCIAAAASEPPILEGDIGAESAADVPDSTRPFAPPSQARRAASLGRGSQMPIEIPPVASSFATMFYQDEATRIKIAADHRLKSMSLQRTDWLNTPNTYQKEEVEEIGTSNPKKITYWVEGDVESKKTSGGMAMAIENRQHFAPQGNDPQELRDNLKKVKTKYYKDVRSAGPQSKILDGFDGDTVDLTVDSARDALGHVRVVGAVSKGIIKRSQRHNAGIYQSICSPNPFTQVNDEELQKYRRDVNRKEQGLPTEEEEEEAEEEALRRKRLQAALDVEMKTHILDKQAGEILSPELCVRSDTSATEMSPTEIGQVKHDGSPLKEKRKKKRRFKMPSFAFRSKEKEK